MLAREYTGGTITCDVGGSKLYEKFPAGDK
nr:MAG TPA: hypothetical protein [Caudoviricetes sp.]